jgi:G:T/U-mismatch repair DNA glycosylase
MPCDHKFIDFLTLDKLDFKPKILIVGTFNPLIEGNDANWFYGRKENNFWDVLPRIHGEPSLKNASPKEWKRFCKRNLIAITDLISCIDDADLNNPDHVSLLKTYSDKSIAVKFKEHKTVKIEDLLDIYKSIQSVYLTRGTSDKFWKSLWEPVEEFIKDTGRYESKLMTPSNYAFFQQAKYNRENPKNSLGLSEYILMRWEKNWNFDNKK